VKKQNKLAMLLLTIICVNVSLASAEQSSYTDSSGKKIFFDSKTQINNAQYSNEGVLVNASISGALWINETTGEQFRVNAEIKNNKITQIVKTSENPALSIDDIKESINNWVTENVWTVVITTIVLFAVLYRAFLKTMTQPFVRLTLYETMGKVEIGKYVESYPISESSGALYCHKFKAGKGIRKIYSTKNWGAYDLAKWFELAKVTHYYPWLVLFEDYEVPLGLTIYDFKIVKHWRNYIIYPFYIVSNIFGFASLTNRLYKFLKKEKKKQERVDFVIPILSLNQVEDRFNVKYVKYEMNPTTGKREYVEKRKANLSYSEYLNLKKMEDKTVEGTEFRLVKNLTYSKQQKVRQFTDLAEAMHNLRTRLQERAETQFQIMKYQEIAEDNYQLYQETLEQLETRKMTEGLRFNKMLEPILMENEKRTIALPVALANFVKFRTPGLSDEEAMEKSMKETLKEVYLEGDEKLNYIKENSELRARLENMKEILRDRLTDIDNNQITIRSEQPNTEEVNE